VNKLRALVQLTSEDRWLLTQAFIAMVICRVRLRVHNIEKLRVWAAHPGNGATAVDRLVWAVEVASRRMPGATCLCRALALQRMLAKNGYGSELRIGIEKNDDQFGAHAWLVHSDRVLIGDSQLEKFQLLATWQAGASLSASRRKDAA